MNLFLIAWRNLQHRWFASFLTCLSMALGVTLVVIVLTVAGKISESFERSKSVCYNLLIGPKGSPIQLTLNSVFLLSEPVGTLPYSYYMEFLPGNERQADFERVGGELDDPDRSGKYAPFVNGGFAIPICLGDYVDEFRVVATTADYFSVLTHGPAADKPYEFADGKNFAYDSAENGFFEGVVGAVVADKLGLQVGDQVSTTHGPNGEDHGTLFTIVGILELTGTAVDRGVFINIEGFFRVEGHAAPERDELTGLDTSDATDETGDDFVAGKQGQSPLPVEKREISAILLKTMPAFGSALVRPINKSRTAMAVSPFQEITIAIETFFEPLRLSLLFLTFLVCIVSAISILVSIYNSMNERTHDIAVMRALGAGRVKVLLIILSESFLISIAGGIIGWVAGHAIAAWAGLYFGVKQRAGVEIGFFSLNAREEIYVVPLLVLIGVLAGLLPAIMAYRTDVSRSLSK